ncbi:MAG: copper amine oxidase N-terminal domain-containing protein [Peptostreptococcaceae bacterium]|nr:copper amine oxidase N-terminal domain-containing protein [Peptostreptococcaceae bacterium]
MKKRLSLLMAALMIITMLPMSAFAAATAVYTTLDIPASLDDVAGERKNVTVTFKVPKGSTINPGTLRLEIDNGAAFRAANTAQLGGAEVKIDGFTNVTLAATGATQPADNLIFIKLGGAPDVNLGADATITLNIPVYFPNTGDVMLKLTDEDNTGVGTLAPMKVAVVRDTTAGLSVTAKDPEKAVSFDGGELSQFEIKDFAKTLKAVAPAGYTREMEITIDDDAVKFDAAAPAPITQMFVDGVAAGTVAANKLTVVPGDVALTSKSVLVLPVVDRMGRHASEGSVRVNVRIFDKKAGEPDINVASASAVIGKIVDYKVTMTIVEKGKREIPSVWGGEKVMVTVTLKGPKGSISDRPIDFTADGADVTFKNNTEKATKPNTAFFEGRDDEGVFKDAEFSLAPIARDLEEVKFDIELRTAASKDGVATLTAAQRGWEVKADAVKITPKLAIKSEEMPVKKGEARETANIVITEAKAGLLTRQDKLQIRFNTRRSYTQFATSAVKIEATNGMKFGDPSYKKIGDQEKFAAIEFPITKQSSGEAAVITISGVKVLVDGSSTDDVIKVYAALNGANVVNTEYIKVVKEYALESILTVFTIGQTQYTVNGQAKTAASAPYVKNGRTMLPVRALAESLGLHVQWNGQTKTATFTDSTKVAAVVIGAETMHINGTPVKLAAKAELVNGTTFIELRSLATAFGVQIDWDAAAKTATVSK